MDKSQTVETPESSPAIVNSITQIESDSDVEAVSVSNKSPLMPSSMERSPPPQLPDPDFWVEPPPRPKDYDEYKRINPPRLKKREKDGDEDNKDGSKYSNRVPIMLVGEMDDNGRGYYFAKVNGEFIEKFTKESVQHKYPGLVNEYSWKAKNNKLPAFDPSSTEVHPRHRLKTRLKLGKPSKREKGQTRLGRSFTTQKPSPAANGDSDLVVSSNETDSDSDTDTDTDSDSDVVPFRQSTRLANLPQAKRSGPPRLRNLRSSGKESSPTDNSSDRNSVYVVESDDSTDKEKRLKITLKRPRPKREIVHGLGTVRTVSDDEESDSEAEGSYLRRHRDRCDKCDERPANEQLEAYERKKKRKGKSGRPKKKEYEDEESESEEDRLERLGGWIRCLHCCVSKHWGCLTIQEKQAVLLAVQSHETENRNSEKRLRGWDVPENAPMVEKRKAIWLDQTTEFICDLCVRTAPCIVCREDTSPQGPALAPVAPPPPSVILAGGSEAENAIDLTTPPPEPAQVQHATDTKSTAKPLAVRKPNEVHTTYADPRWPQVLFRCMRCRRPAHWQHVLARDPKDDNQRTAMQIAKAVQHGPEAWKCHDCVRWKHPAEAILAWRPDPPNAVETIERGVVPDGKEPLRREYLVKFKERGFKRVEWVPHMWLFMMHRGILRHFLKAGTRLALLEDDSEEFQEKIGRRQKEDKGKGKARESGGALDVLPVFARSRSASAEGDKNGKQEYEGTPGPLLDAELRIPNSWLRIDRVLDMQLRAPSNRSTKKSIRGKGKSKPKRVADSDDELISDSNESTLAADAREFVEGEEPSKGTVESILEFERRTGRMPTQKEIIERAVWVFTKFEGLQYDECTWDSPPRPGSLEWDSYIKAIPRYLFARSVEVPKLTKAEENKRDNRAKKSLNHWSHLDWQPKTEDTSLSLMPFQVQGLQWLYANWWNLQPSILADDMGLGKTVQLVSLVGKLVKENVYPHLIVVPNSTIVNWIREFERWTPHVRVVQFNGEAKARQIIKQYELYNSDNKPMYHAIVTTYETLQGAEFGPVFKKVGRWEMVVVDEGQRLKSDSSLLFRKLTELNTIHRILMTGTPLNNNIRELFNLMNFLDPEEWGNLDALEKEYDQENLTEELVARLHERLRPYFLRRQKSEVLDLPDKHEVIVPISLAPIQKDIMRAILEANLSTLGLLADKNTRESRKGAAPKRTTLNNALMEMRKCIQHPYLNQSEMERRGLSQEETLKQLVDASAKFRLLQKLLPQLKQRGHRVLLFSQFKIVLDIIEDFLNMEGYKLLRLDGETKSSLRQKEIDDFNRPGSDYFIYILTTRAGGVGVNLWSADTVIVFDPDFNPHQDLQAIARAHRYGQKKRVMVFKFMAKDTPEEKIFMMGKKKLVLDHLIVQKLGDDDEVDDIQGILTYGAKALFENPGESASDIKYTDRDIEELVTRAETEKTEEKKSTEGGMKFDFAQVWDRGKGITTDMPEDNQDAGPDDDFWAAVIKRAAEEKAKKRAQELTGRGARKRAIANYNETDLLDGSPEKPKAHKPKPGLDSKKGTDSDREFKPPGNEPSSSSDESIDAAGSDDVALPTLENGSGIAIPNIALPGTYPPLTYPRPPVALPPGYNPAAPLPGPTFAQGVPPPKVKKPRKPQTKNPAPLAIQPGGKSGQVAIPAGPSTLPAATSSSSSTRYNCQLCHTLHDIGECAVSRRHDIDMLLSTRADIMRPDNEDEETHKFWALGHIDKKLAELNVDVLRLPNPHFQPAPVPKLKAPRTSGAISATAKVPALPSSEGSSRINGSGNSKTSTGPKAAPDIPKPRKKKSTVLAPGHSVSGTPASHTSLPNAAPSRAAPRPSVSSKSSGLHLHSVGNSAVNNIPANPPNRPYNAPSGASSYAYPLATGVQPGIVRTAPTSSLQVPRPTGVAAPRPSAAPLLTLSSSPPPLSQVIASTSKAALAAPTNKRPAANVPEEPRKRRIHLCMICGQIPGHNAVECPKVQTVEGIRTAIQKFKTEGGNKTMQAALERMLARREGRSYVPQ